MRKDFKEKKEVEITVRRTVCDICDSVVEDGIAAVRLSTFIERATTPEMFYNNSIPPGAAFLEICSAACLEKNIKGIILILNSKMIPSAPDNKNAFVSLGGDVANTAAPGTITISSYQASTTPR